MGTNVPARAHCPGSICNLVRNNSGIDQQLFMSLISPHQINLPELIGHFLSINRCNFFFWTSPCPVLLHGLCQGNTCNWPSVKRISSFTVPCKKKVIPCCRTMILSDLGISQKFLLAEAKPTNLNGEQ